MFTLRLNVERCWGKPKRRDWVRWRRWTRRKTARPSEGQIQGGGLWAPCDGQVDRWWTTLQSVVRSGSRRKRAWRGSSVLCRALEWKPVGQNVCVGTRRRRAEGRWSTWGQTFKDREGEMTHCCVCLLDTLNKSSQKQAVQNMFSLLLTWWSD